VALALLSSNFVGLKSAWADSMTRTNDIGNSPNHSAFNLGDNGIHLTNFFSNTISTMDRHSNKMFDTTRVAGDTPVGIAISHNNNDIHVANPSSEPVYVIDRCYDKVIHTLLFDIDCTPFTSVFNPTNNDIHVSDAFSNTIFIIESFSNKVVNMISVGNFPQGIAFDLPNNDMYVTKLWFK
jgi:YVTN family beta-propeller protein